jgi:hypothetical protein
MVDRYPIRHVGVRQPELDYLTLDNLIFGKRSVTGRR